jgi:hypothetical protein
MPISTKCELSQTSIFDADITIVQNYKNSKEEETETIQVGYNSRTVFPR